MSRDIGADLAAEVVKSVLYPFFALSIILPEPVYAWTGIGTLTFDGQDWDGIGDLGSIGTVEESSDGTASQMTFGLSGIRREFYDYLIEQPYRGALTTLYVGALDEAMVRVAAGPTMIYRGRVVAVDLLDGEGLTISVTVERSSRDQTRARVRRYTNQEQQRLHTGDKFFEFVPQMQTVQVLWGREG